MDSDSGISILIKDLGKEESLSEIAELAPTVVIDDASHIWSHQISALIVLFQSLKSGGVYILEDIHTSFRVTKGWGFDDLGMSAYDFCTAIQEVVTSGEHLNRDNHSYCIATMAEEIEAIAIQVDMISFVGKSCILIKK